MVAAAGGANNRGKRASQSSSGAANAKGKGPKRKTQSSSRTSKGRNPRSKQKKMHAALLSSIALTEKNYPLLFNSKLEKLDERLLAVDKELDKSDTILDSQKNMISVKQLLKRKSLHEKRLKILKEMQIAITNSLAAFSISGVDNEKLLSAIREMDDLNAEVSAEASKSQMDMKEISRLEIEFAKQNPNAMHEYNPNLQEGMLEPIVRIFTVGKLKL